MRVCVLLAVDSRLQLFDVTEEEKGARVIDVVSKRGVVVVVVVTLLEYSSFFDSIFRGLNTNADFCHGELIPSRRYVKSVSVFRVNLFAS